VHYFFLSCIFVVDPMKSKVSISCCDTQKTIIMIRPALLLLLSLFALVARASIETTTPKPDDLSICDEYFFGRQTSTNTSSTSTQNNNLPFCANGGFCKASWVRDVDHPCECLADYGGPHCEFAAGTVPSRCTLSCQHGGQCKIGASSWQQYVQHQAAADEMNMATSGWSNPLDLQHCECTQGYTGLLCELAGTPCGDGFCHNGGTCVQTAAIDGSGQHFCDCSTAKKGPDGTTALYAGDYCENEATTFCSNDHNGNQFCVNGGTCKAES
jgi:hypothetical protein